MNGPTFLAVCQYARDFLARPALVLRPKLGGGLETATEQPWALRQVRQPTADDIIEWLRAHPAEAVKVLKGCKVAGPWVPYVGGQGCARFGHGASIAWVMDPDDDYPGWRWRSPGHRGAVIAEGLEEAKAAADAALVAAGWVLA